MQNAVTALAAGGDNARRWIEANRADDGYADIGGNEWGSSLAVIGGVELERVRLADVTIFPNIVDSSIADSHFRGLTTDGHFWGAGNRWRRCCFSDSKLRRMISPMNSFDDCEFRGVVFAGYNPHETLFKKCCFHDCTFDALRVVPKRDHRWSIAEMAPLRSSLQFAACRFLSVSFNQCKFRESAFQDCTFTDPSATECEFDEINSDHQWWQPSSQGSVFVSYLNQVIDEITRRLGGSSAAAKALSEYRQAFLQGETTSKDYSACFYTDHVPDPELEVVEEIIDRLGPRFGF